MRRFQLFELFTYQSILSLPENIEVQGTNTNESVFKKLCNSIHPHNHFVDSAQQVHIALFCDTLNLVQW